MTQRITELVVGDDPEAWQAAGFTVDGSACRVGEVMVRLAGSAGDRGIRSWTLAGVDLAGRHDIDGVPSEPSPTADEATAPAAGAEHPNGTTRIDHVVLVTPDLGRTVDALAAIGLELRRTRDTDSPESPMRQAFFRIGEVILEVVGPPEPSDDGPSRWYGLAFAVDDLD
ncbi:MAG: hypothetical protein JWM05_1008, partial [Acidimicrobiales bacterium]|nr:hypothetical protein [Acidimicrobiales bacterium]